MADRGGLENRYPRKRVQGSNPCLSAPLPSMQKENLANHYQYQGNLNLDVESVKRMKTLSFMPYFEYIKMPRRVLEDHIGLDRTQEEYFLSPNEAIGRRAFPPEGIALLNAPVLTLFLILVVRFEVSFILI